MHGYFTLVFVFFQLTIRISQASINQNNLPPVILVPGDGGSRLAAKLDKPSTVHVTCDKTTKDYFTLWLDVQRLLPIAIDCWVDNIKLTYDDETNKTLNQPGVDVVVPEFGDPEMVEYLDPHTRPLVGGYFNHISNFLVDNGYVRKQNLFGAPYDFRKGASELGTFFERIKDLIQRAYESNGKKRVVLVAHSMGGPLTLIFLQEQTQEWKDKYIRSLVSLAGAYGGSVKAVKIFAAGDDLGIFIIDQRVLKQVTSTLPSSAFLMPHKELWKDEVVVETAQKNYTMNDMEQFFKDINYTTGWKMFLNEKTYTENLSAPGVEVHCLYGQGISTLKRLIYISNKFPDEPMFQYENGDGTVNLRSLEVCKKWINSENVEVQTLGLEGITHMSILEDKGVTEYLEEKITNWSNEY